VSARSGFWYAHTLQHAITTGDVSVRLSVCPAHGGNTSKLITVGSCGVYYRATHGPVVFLTPTFILWIPGETPLRWLQTRLRWVKAANNANFRSINNNRTRCLVYLSGGVNKFCKKSSVYSQLKGIGDQPSPWIPTFRRPRNDPYHVSSGTLNRTMPIPILIPYSIHAWAVSKHNLIHINFTDINV